MRGEGTAGGTEVTEDERERGLTAFREGRYADAAAIYAKIAERTRRKLSLGAEAPERVGHSGASPFGHPQAAPPVAADAIRRPPGFERERECSSSSSSSSSSSDTNRMRRESGSSSNSRFSATNYDFFDQHQQRCSSHHLEWEVEEKGEGEGEGEGDGGGDGREPPCANLLQLLGEGVGAGKTRKI